MVLAVGEIERKYRKKDRRGREGKGREGKGREGGKREGNKKGQEGERVRCQRYLVLDTLTSR